MNEKVWVLIREKIKTSQNIGYKKKKNDDDIKYHCH